MEIGPWKAVVSARKKRVFIFRDGKRFRSTDLEAWESWSEEERLTYMQNGTTGRSDRRKYRKSSFRART